MQPTYPPDADDATKHALLDAFEAQMETYQSDLGLYETWLREEKSAKAILLASMEIDLARSLRGLATSHLMWDHLCRSYEIRNEAMYLAVVEEAQSLRQLDSTVEDFHRKMSDVWHRLDNLGAELWWWYLSVLRPPPGPAGHTSPSRVSLSAASRVQDCSGTATDSSSAPLAHRGDA
jgi:hypothetical protein